MNASKFKALATIEGNGAILLGKNFVCDAFAKRPVRIVTHAHADHMWGLGESLLHSKVITTPLTKELLRILQPKLDINKIESIDYNLEKEFDGNRQCTSSR